MHVIVSVLFLLCSFVIFNNKSKSNIAELIIGRNKFAAARDDNGNGGVVNYGFSWNTTSRIANYNNNNRKNQKQVLFLHVGKAGGGTIDTHLRRLHVGFKKCHRPCPEFVQDAQQMHNYNILINIRDPVDRFISAFYWGSLIYCNAHNETRTELQKINRKTPDKFCRPYKERNPKLKIIREIYQTNASLMAEALCSSSSSSSNEEEEESAAIIESHNNSSSSAAKEHISHITHANHPIAAYFYGNDTTTTTSNTWRNNNNNTRITAVVLEPGFDFELQVDEAIKITKTKSLFLWNNNNGTQQQQHATKTKTIHSSLKMHHSSTAWSNQSQPQVSELGKCCVARHYAKDYEIIQELITEACHGKYATMCRHALESILHRRAHFLDTSLSCQKIVNAPAKKL